MENINSIDDIRKLHYYDGRTLPKEEPCIYFIINEERVFYVGQTTKMNKRISEYKNLLMFSLMINERLALYYMPCDKRMLLEKEKYYINKFTPALNKERRNVIDNSVVADYLSKQEKRTSSIYNFVLQCLSEKRDAFISIRIPLWMKQSIKDTGKSASDLIITRLAEIMYKQKKNTRVYEAKQN